MTFPKCDAKSQEHPLFEQEENTLESSENINTPYQRQTPIFVSLNSVFSGNWLAENTCKSRTSRLLVSFVGSVNMCKSIFNGEDIHQPSWMPGGLHCNVFLPNLSKSYQIGAGDPSFMYRKRTIYSACVITFYHFWILNPILTWNGGCTWAKTTRMLGSRIKYSNYPILEICDICSPVHRVLHFQTRTIFWKCTPWPTKCRAVADVSWNQCAPAYWTHQLLALAAIATPSSY